MVGYLMLIATVSFSSYYFVPFLSFYLDSIHVTDLVLSSVYFQIPGVGYLIGSVLFGKLGQQQTANLKYSSYFMVVPVLMIGGILEFDANI